MSIWTYQYSIKRGVKRFETYIYFQIVSFQETYIPQSKLFSLLYKIKSNILNQLLSLAFQNITINTEFIDNDISSLNAFNGVLNPWIYNMYHRDHNLYYFRGLCGTTFGDRPPSLTCHIPSRIPIHGNNILISHICFNIFILHTMMNLSHKMNGTITSNVVCHSNMIQTLCL